MAMSALELSDLMDQMGAGDLYYAIHLMKTGDLVVVWGTGEMETLPMSLTMSSRLPTYLFDRIAEMRLVASGPKGSANAKSRSSDDDTLPLWPSVPGYGSSSHSSNASDDSGRESSGIDFDLVERDASECREAYCRKCGEKCKWVQLLSSRVWSCPQC